MNIELKRFDDVKYEIQVREIFYKYVEQFGFKIIQSRQSFPDYLLEGKSGLKYWAEAEYDLANFIAHVHDPMKVNFIIFWKDSLIKVPQWYRRKYDTFLFEILVDLPEELRNIGITSEKLFPPRYAFLNLPKALAEIGVFYK